MINQLPTAGSKLVADTNKWQKKGGFFVSQTLWAFGCRRMGTARAVGHTQMALRLVERTAAALAMARSR